MGVGQLLTNIKKGKQGKNIGISTGIPKLDSVIYGIQRKYLYVVAADQGSGKTSFAIDKLVYNALKNRGNKIVNILYYSFEMASDVLYAKLLSLHIYDTYNKIITYESILSLTRTITDEEYDYVIKSTEWLLELQKYFTIYDKALTPAGIYATCKEWLKQFGTFEQINEHKEDYIENDSESYKIVLVDHIGLVAGELPKKQKIDTVCDYFIYFRNKCNISGVLVQQINRNSKAMDRRTGGYELLQLDDLSDSSGTSQAAEVVIMLYYPHREKISKCEGYNIKSGLKNRGRILQIVKNRYGRSEINIGLSFFGEIGLFKELPLPEEINDYSIYTDLNEVEKNIEQDIENNTDNVNKNLFIF